jgi:hypothetical protein
MEPNYITGKYFKKRLVDLCLRSGLTEFPSKHWDQLILLKSIANMFVSNKIYTEAEVNQSIKQWLADMSNFSSLDFDYMMLRRNLVDERLLARNPDGSGYWLNPLGPAKVVFDPTITEIEVNEVLTEGQKLIVQKKADYLKIG